MNFRIIKTLFIKDFTLFFKNRFIAVITVLGLVFYLFAYFFLPKTVDEVMEIGVYAPVMPPIIERIQNEGLKIETYKIEKDLKEAVSKGKVVAGLVFPADIMEKLKKGEKPIVKTYLSAELEPEIKSAISIFVNELFFIQAGYTLAIEVIEETIGPDMVGKQVSPGKRIIPLLVFFLLITETFGLANLISEEIEKRTIQALLVTPTRIQDIFIAKGLTGLILALSQALLFLVIVGELKNQPLLILITLLLGCIIVTGISFLIGSVARDMMSVLAWGVIAFIVLLVPSINILLPGAIVTNWVKILPTYYLTESIHRVMNFGYSWQNIWQNLLILLVYSLGILSVGVYILKRRYQ